MVCLYCHAPSTRVANSRPHASQSVVWRRRQCERCRIAVTTYETVSAKELPLVTNDDATTCSYSIPRLMISLYEDLPRINHRADHAWELAHTVTQKLLQQAPSTLTPAIIAQQAYLTLRAYRAASGMRYGLRHDIIRP